MFKILGVLTVFGAWLAAIVGWILNIYQVVTMAVAAAPVTTLFVLKIVGIIIAPLGVIFGYVGL